MGVDKFVKKTGSNLLNGLTYENAWENYAYGYANVGSSNRLRIGTGIYSESRATVVTPIANGVAGDHTIITDNGDGPVTLRRSGGWSGLVYFTEVGVPHRYITFQGTSPGQLIFDGQNQVGMANIYLGNVSEGNTDFSLINLRIKDAHGSGVLAGQSANLIVRGCEIDHNGVDVTQDHGLYCGGNLNALVEDNIFHHNGSNGFRHGGNQSAGGNLICRRNRSYQNGLGADGLGNTGRGIIVYDSDNAQIYNNECFLNAYAGIEVGRGTGTKLYHNSCHDNGNPTVGSGYGIVLGSFNNPVNTTIKNNVSLNNKTDDLHITSNASGTVYSWNLFSAAGITDNGISSTNGGNNPVTGVDTAVWVAPTHATAALRNYHLKAGSAAIGAATTNEVPPLAEVTTDKDGVTRPYADFVCLGAFEFVPDEEESAPAQYVSHVMIDTDNSSTDTLETSAFATSGINRHLDVIVGIASNTPTSVVNISRSGEPFAKQRGDWNPAGSQWEQGEFWMSLSEPPLAAAAVSIVLSTARQSWGATVVVVENCDQAERIRGGLVTLNPDGEGVVDNLAFGSVAGDLVVSAIVGNAGTMPSAIAGSGTLRGSWQTASPGGWGLMATASGAPILTLGFNGDPFRFVHYAVSHPPVSSTRPNPPTGLIVTNYSASSQILSFSGPGDNGGSPVTGYKIERESPVGGGWTTIVADTASTATTYQVNGLTALTQYNYRVSAINSIGTSDPSSASNWTTPQVGNNAQLAFQAWNNYYIPSLPIASAMNQAGQQQIQHQPRSPLYILDTFPILVVPGTQYTQRGFTTAMGGVSVIDTNGDLDTIRVEATSGQAWVTLHGCTVTVGSLGTNDFTIQGTQANLLAAIASLSYTGTVKGEQAIILTATDALGHQDTKFFTVMVLNNAPVITSNGGGASTAINVEEGQTAVTTVVATDLDPSDDLVYGIVGGADAAKFSIDDETGVLTFVEAPDHDVPTDADMNNVYEVIVQATDGEAVDIQTLSVTVTIVPIPVSRSFALPVEWRYDMQGPLVVASMEWTTIVPALFIEVPMELALALGKVALVPTEARGIHVLERSASHEWIMNLGVERVVPAAWLTAAFSQRTAFADYWGPVTVARVVSMESRGQIASIDQARTVGHEWVLAVSRESGVIPHWHGISVIFQSSPVLESSRGMLRLHVLPMEWVVSVENAKSASSESLQSPIASLVLPHEALGLVRAPREVMDEARQWLASPHAVTGEWAIAHQAGKVLPFESLRATKVGGLVPYEDWGMHGRFFVIPFEILKQI